MRMRWVDLLFAHWPIPAEELRPLVPDELEIDTFGGRAYLGIVPFGMEDVAPRGLPALPVLGAFLEVNVRTYVRQDELPGVWFLSLDAGSRLAVEGARIAFHLPYLHASMAIERDGDAVRFRSDRRDRRAPRADIDVRYGPMSGVSRSEPRSLEAWLTNRWRLFAADGRGRLSRTEIRHGPWPLRAAWAEFATESLAASHGLTVPGEAPHLLFADRLDVVAWLPRPA